MADHLHRVVDILKSTAGKFLMLKTKRFVLNLAAAILLGHLCGCESSPPPSTTSTTPPATTTPPSSATGTAGVSPAACDCSIFPPKSGCDAQCGITTGIVESVSADSVVIQVPSITTNHAGKKALLITRKTFSIGAAEAKQLQSIPKGSRVALTFRKEGGQSVVKSIRQIPPEPAS
jgi:Cu/Ag efflux protein CusF